MFCPIWGSETDNFRFWMLNLKSLDSFVSKTILQQILIELNHPIELYKCCFWLITDVFCHFLSVGASKTEIFDFLMRNFNFWGDFVSKNMTQQTPCGPKHHIERQKCCFWSIISVFGHFLSIGESETDNFKFSLQNMKSLGDFVSENMLQNNFLGESFFFFLIWSNICLLYTSDAADE